MDTLPASSVTGKSKQNVWGFFCPLCQVPRSLSFNPRLTRRHVLQVFSGVLFLDLLLWDVFSWRGFFLFVPLWGIFEIYYRLRRRMKLRCSQCGFDPYLVLNDLDLAKKAIESHWVKKYQERKSPKRHLEGKVRKVVEGVASERKGS